ncbi:MAG: nitric oxide reductase, partial [Rhodocyclaceae bacterium]|nr:nitric oxide reductase [Rhodocyclaceae bacterium]
MEEWVGGLWDRFITGRARRDHPEASVRLADLEKTLGVLFRALGGDPGLRVAAAAEARHGARRRFLSRLAGTDEKASRASLDLETLRLPPAIAVFPEAGLNRDLYLWLIALAAHDAHAAGGGWIARNQQATLAALARYPGLEPRYRRLVDALCAERIDPTDLPADEAAQEEAVRLALRNPGSVAELPPLSGAESKPVQPVPLWLYPSPLAGQAPDGRKQANPGEGGGEEQVAAERKRHQAERTDKPESEHGLLMLFRAESLMSFAEFIKVNRSLDDDPNPDAGKAAEELDKLTVMRDGERVASKVRFDLDLPSAAEDDLPAGPGIPLPEWDHRKRCLVPGFCRIQPMVARGAAPIALPERLRRPARKLRSQFAALAPVRRWYKAQPDGTELDIDACVRLHTDKAAGYQVAGAGAYLAHRTAERDLACLVLADLSLSTDTWISDGHRVIDVIRDSLMLFAEALRATGDRYAFYGVSSLRRDNVRFHDIKSFEEPLDDAARGRIAALKPGYYTRMGAAIRHATDLLDRQPTSVRL